MGTSTTTAYERSRVRPSPTAALLLLSALTLAAMCIAFFLPRIPQDPAYNRFADNRTLLGIPHFLDVVSNACFLLVGALGLVFLLGSEKRSTGASLF
jgi:hypothetical protein